MTESITEMLETFDVAGRSTGVCPRSIIHRSGLWHRSANVILFTTDERMIMQKRSQRKDVCPGVWDLSVAEHLQPGETFLDAAYRGLREELSLDDIRLVPFGPELCLRYEPAGLDVKDYEFQRLFLGHASGELRCNGDEIDATDYIRLEDAIGIRRSSPETLTPWFCAWLDALAHAAFSSTDWQMAGDS